jgi:hypothetical protein
MDKIKISIKEGCLLPQDAGFAVVAAQHLEDEEHCGATVAWYVISDTVCRATRKAHGINVVVGHRRSFKDNPFDSTEGKFSGTTAFTCN